MGGRQALVERGIASCWHGDPCPWHKRGLCFFGHSSAPPQVREQTAEMVKMIPQERLETVERKLVEEIVTERDLRRREAGDLRSAVESVREHIEHFKADTFTTLDALERKLALETAACFDTIKLMQAWFLEVESKGAKRDSTSSKRERSLQKLPSNHCMLISATLGVGEISATRLRRTSSSVSSRGLMNCAPISLSIKSILASPKSSKRAPVPPSRLWTKKWVSKQPLVSILPSQCKLGPPM